MEDDGGRVVDVELLASVAVDAYLALDTCSNLLGSRIIVSRGM